MAIYGYTKNYKLIKPQFNTDTWHDYIYDNLDTIDAVMSAIYASGNWKGFWATNTVYAAGDVIIDQATDAMYKVMVDHTTSESTFAAEWTAHPTYYELWSPNNLAESWATKTDGKVSNTDYSAKAYAVSSGLIDDGSAKEWAVGSGAIGNTNEYSAKKYATDAHNDYISMTTDVNVIAVGSNIANVNTVGQSISNVNTVAGDISSVNVAATNIEFIKAAENNANDAKNSKIEAQNSAVTAQLMATQAQEWAIKTDGKVDGTNYSSKYYAGQASNSAQAAQNALDTVNGLIATPIGTIFQSVYVDESMDIARQLNGQLISSTKFTGFRSWLNTVQTACPNLFTTETNWQAEKTNSKLGQCGKFVIDDTAGTIRLPCVVNAQSLTDLQYLGMIKNESLPNITGYINNTSPAGQDYFEGGALYWKNKNYDFPSALINATDKNYAATIRFDASRSSPTYQDNAPVQQEAVQYPYYIQVATGVEETLPAIREYQVNNSDYFGKSMYSDVAPNNASWLASNGSYNSRSVYPDYYDWLNGKIGQVVTANGGKVVLSTNTITDYDFVVNQNDQTFRLPLLNGSEDLPGTEITSSIFSEITTTAQSYTCPTNGFVFVTCAHDVGTLVVACNNSGVSLNGSSDSDNRESAYFFAKKGDVISVALNIGTQNSTTSYFLKAVGNGTLYYYVGDTVQDASLINAGAVLGQLSNKADANLNNVDNTGNAAASNLNSKGIRTVIETYHNGTEWYRIWSDGWVEQGGQSSVGTTVNLLKPFVNTSYSLRVTTRTATAGAGYAISQRVGAYITKSTFKCESQSGDSVGYNWVACGYIS